MIVVFPLLMDNTISSNIIPGICATLERFLIVYKSDEIMKIGGLSPAATAAGVARGTAEILVTASIAALSQILAKKYLSKTFGENKETLPHQDLFISNMLLELQEDKKNFLNTYNILEDFYEMHPEPPKTKTPPKEENKIRSKTDITFNDVLKSKLNLEVKTGKLDLNTTLSLEPTYITISGKWGTEVIGVKVIPNNLFATVKTPSRTLSSLK